MERPRVSIVIPCYQTGSSIIGLFNELNELLSQKWNWELILVCDACPIDSWQYITQITKENPAIIRSFLLGKNVGQHQATWYGIAKAAGEYIVTMDDDGQHIPNTIPLLLNAMKDDFDLIYGLPIKDEHGPLRNILSKSLKSFLSATRIMKHARKISALRVFSSKLLSEEREILKYDGLVDAYLIARTDRIGTLQIEMRKRVDGNSNYSISKLINHALEMLFSSTDIPLIALTKLGFFGAVISIGLAFLTLVNSLVNRIEVPGYASIVIFFGFSMFLVLLLLGIIGRTIFRMKSKDLGQDKVWVRDSSDSRIHDSEEKDKVTAEGNISKASDYQ